MTVENEQWTDAWTSYWRSGPGTSCISTPDVEVRLAGIWNAHTDALHDGARLLDLATGNGTVARKVAARALERRIRLHITAVDSAAIDPPAFAADPAQLFRHIEFQGGVRLEALPFTDGHFDSVVSQFGFEYADESQAAAEATRVLAPGGLLRFVVHAQDGAVSLDIGRRVERLTGVLADGGPVALILQLARAAEAGDVATLRRMSGQLAAAASQVRDLSRDPPSDDSALFYSREVLSLWAERNDYWPADLRRSVEQGWQTASGVLARQQQMLRVARSAEDIRQLGDRWRAAGLSVDAISPIQDDDRGVQIAWLVDASRPR